jgi:hypothetical protein
MKKISKYVTRYGYTIFPNPEYSNHKPYDKNCGNCCGWSKLNQWCNKIDSPVKSSKANCSHCKCWEWVVPKYLYPGMEGYETAKEKEELHND